METSSELVAGATGLVGSEICRLPSTKNLTVIAMDRTTAGPVKIKQLTKSDVQVVQRDQNNFVLNNHASKFLLYLPGTFSLDVVSKTNTNPIHSVFAKCDQY